MTSAMKLAVEPFLIRSAASAGAGAAAENRFHRRGFPLFSP